MILTNEQLVMLCKYVGQGPIDKASLIILGNEFGCANAGANTKLSIEKFMLESKTKKSMPIGNGFVILDRDAPPVTSTFLQYISRLALALKHKDERFFGELSVEGKSFINDYIMNKLYVEDTAILNLRFLPQSTERHWPYENISESAYHNMYDFTVKNPKPNILKDTRIRIIKEALNILRKDALILGAGDRYNKRAFFESIYPTIKFSETELSETYKIYSSNNLDKRIILSNYLDNRTLGLSNLKLLYSFILNFKSQNSDIPKITSSKLF